MHGATGRLLRSGVLCLALGLLLAGPALAEERKGLGAVLGMDPDSRSILIENTWYQVVPGTLIQDLAGEPIAWEDMPLPVIDENDLMPILWEGRYRAVSQADGWKLLSLRLRPFRE